MNTLFNIKLGKTCRLVSQLSFFGILLAASFYRAYAVEIIPVTIEQVIEKSFADIIKEVGKINAIDSAQLTFNASETITAIHFNDGDKIKKGDLIAELDSTKVQADFDKSKSTLALAKTKLERVESLLAIQPEALSKQDVDELKESVNLAAADLRQKQAIVQDYRIVSPFNGQLTSFSQSIGSHISANTVLGTLYDLNPVEVQYSISQGEFGKAEKGQEVQVTVEAYQDRVFKGVVSYVAPAIDESSGRVEIRAQLDNPDYQLAPGMFANIKQYFSHGIKRLLVPQNSVIANNQQRFVWLIRDNKAIKQAVVLGHNTNDGYVVITSGITAGDSVVKTGMQNLSEGSEVTILSDKIVSPSQGDS
ncbi:efflux RND transporter periplasmic adaptor subunit [Endozoicomonas sp.]|uniref:efflux RND transporter periplasmic adaptor subunit n=1 Tax=Endozoicomonas sp. TaxID=1892382 RepID=UPI002887BB20|nr:efflux RND transporter periplasmic adaptor subunit [Endozoicomonas sp.]